MTDIVERLRETVIADAFERGSVTSGPLAERLIRERGEAAQEIEKLRAGLREITTHWAISYDHPHANTEMYRGSYGIGVVDGHRAAAAIAHRTLGEET